MMNVENPGAEKVLIVDDEPRILSSLEDLLEQEFAVLGIDDPQQALDLLKTVEVSVIVSDQRMPRLTGDQFLERAQELSDAPRILLTGYADIDAVVRAVNQGKIYGYVPKPWDPEGLRELVRQAAAFFQLSRTLEQERREMRTLLAESPDGIFFKDGGLRYRQINPAEARRVGIDDPQSALGKTLRELVTSPEAARVEELEQEILERGGSGVDQPAAAPIDGRTHHFSVLRTAILDAHGRGQGLLGISRDVTGRKEAEDALRQSEERFRTTFEEAPFGILDVAPDGTIVRCNRAFAGMLRYDPEALRGAALGDLTHPDDRVESLRILGEVAAGAGRASFSKRYLRQGGEVVWARVTTSGVRGPGGALRYAVSIVEDITAERQLEEELRQAQRMEAVGLLAGGVAHDFNNLLTGIGGFADLALAHKPAEPIASGLHQILALVERAAELTRQLLTFSRRQPTRLQPVDLSQMVGRVGKILQRLIGEQIELVVEAEEAAPVHGDPGQLEQVLFNLAINARDAMPGAGTLTVRTAAVELDQETVARKALESDRWITLRVEDSGTGMDEATRERIFEPFFTTKEQGKGTGLGLSTVFGIVQQHRGFVEVESEPGRGSAFTVYLPWLDREVAPVERPAPAPAPESGQEVVLVVEDEDAVRWLIEEALSGQGYRVLTAGRPAEAIEVFARHRDEVDLLITDVIMPGGNGRDLYERLAAERPGLAVLFMSGYADSHIGHHGVLEPDLAFLQKPFGTQALLRLVREVLDAHLAAG